MTTHRFPRWLDVAAWEEQFKGRGCPLQIGGGWKDAVRREGLHLDLAKVEFVAMGVLARALLLLDSAVAAGVPSSVTLPAPSLMAGERGRLRALADQVDPNYEDVQRQLTRHARARGEALAFMRDVGFSNALHAPHWPDGAVVVKDGGVSSDDVHAEEPAGEYTISRSGYTQYDLRRTLPFQWVDLRDFERLRDQHYFDAAMSGFRELGLSQTDARALSGVLLTELVKNVAEHAAPDSTPKPALVGAIFLTSETYRSRREDLTDRIGELLDTVQATASCVLCLFVGDSGVGVEKRLSTAGPRSGAGPDGGGVGPQPLGRAEDVVLHAFDRWSTSPDRTAPDGTRHESGGLWRVARLVRSYRGSLRVRTGSVMLERLFGRTDRTTDIAEDGVGPAPGTLVQVDMLIDPQGPPQTDPCWADRPAELTGHALELVTCSFDPLRGLNRTDQARLAEAARRIEQDADLAGIVAVIPDANRQSDATTKNALREVLDTASGIANPTAVAVILPNADPHVLELSVGVINSADEPRRSNSGWQGTRSPILVVGAHGPPMWCGGPAPLRNLLEALMEEGGSLSIRDAEDSWHNAEGSPGELERTIRDQQHAFTRTNDRLVLRMSFRDVLRTLVERVRLDLVEAIGSGGPGVELGYFRTPTLRPVRCWIDVDALLAGTVGFDAGAFVLARRIEDRLRHAPRSSAPFVVAQAATAPRQLAGQLSECLALGGRFYAMPGELDLDGIATSEQVPSGARVVLCVDLLSTENTARRAVAAIVRANAIPAAIACVVDARGHRGSIELFNRSIPVISLSEVDIEPDADLDGQQELVDIDPILHRPTVVKSSPASTQSLTEDEFLERCASKPGVLRLGHIARQPRVHFSAYLQLDRLLGDERFRREVTEAMMGILDDGLVAWRSTVEGAGNSRPRFQIWYPGVRDDYAGSLAEALRGGLIDRDHQVAPPLSIPRAIAGSRWTFPDTFGGDQEADCVVIVDWGSLSATTVQQMIRLAADAGAGSIVVVILLNQLVDQDAEALGVQRAVSSNRTKREVPTVIGFVTASSIGGLSSHDCPMCDLRTRYEEIARTAPRRLAKHAEQLRDITRLQARDEVFRATVTDLYNVPVNGTEVADYLRWRGLLAQASRVTSARQEVMDKLGLLAQTPNAHEWNRHSLVRLLAAERQWLKLPPLRYANERTHLAETCRAILTDSPMAPEGLRMQALMVLAACMPERLVEWLPNLLQLVVDQNLLIDQMFLDCHRLLHRSVNDSPVDIEQLRISLLRCRDLLENLPVANGVRAEHLRVVRDLIAIADHDERKRPEDPQSAWDLLRENLMRFVRRHRLDSDLLRVRGVVEDMAHTEPDSAGDVDVQADWDSCANQLAERALANLAPLEDILAGAYVGDRIGDKEQQRLLRLFRSDALVVLNQLGDRLFRIMRTAWEPHSDSWKAQRQALLARINWWYRMFVATHQPDTDRAAVLVELIESMPSNLHERVRQLFWSHQEQVEYDSVPSWRVFCPDKLLDQVVEHVVENAHRHVVPGAVCRFSVEYGSLRETDVRVIIRNTGSRPLPTSRGQGLRSLNEKLEPFGAEVQGRPLVGGEWTFEVTMTLELWRGV